MGNFREMQSRGTGLTKVLVCLTAKQENVKINFKIEV